MKNNKSKYTTRLSARQTPQKPSTVVPDFEAWMKLVILDMDDLLDNKKGVKKL